MKKFGFATAVAGGLIAGALGVTAPAAQAAPVADVVSPVSPRVDHHVWLDQIYQKVSVSQVDSSVHQSR